MLDKTDTLLVIINNIFEESKPVNILLFRGIYSKKFTSDLLIEEIEHRHPNIGSFSLIYNDYKIKSIEKNNTDNEQYVETMKEYVFVQKISDIDIDRNPELVTQNKSLDIEPGQIDSRTEYYKPLNVKLIKLAL